MDFARRLRVSRSAAAAWLGIETVYQDLALCDNLDTVANLFLGRELGGPTHVPRPGRRGRAADRRDEPEPAPSDRLRELGAFRG